MTRTPTAEAEEPLRVAVVAPVAQPVPPERSGSVETVTSLLVEGLASRGHDVTMFATGSSVTNAKLHAVYERGYNQDPSMWPWELCELFNLAAAVERAPEFDVIHYQAEYAPLSLAYHRVSTTPLLQTVHHTPSPPEVALWSRYADAPFVAISRAQARRLAGLNVVATIHHAVDTAAFVFAPVPDDYVLFLGRFTAAKGVLEAIETARRAGLKLVLAAAENEYFRHEVAPLVDGRRVVYAGEVDLASKVKLLGGAQALLYPVQEGEPFGLVLAESMACGTPVAAFDRGAVSELVDDGVTGVVVDSTDALVAALPRVRALDRSRVRSRAVERFGPDRLVNEYLDAYTRVAAGRRPVSTA